MVPALMEKSHFRSFLILKSCPNFVGSMHYLNERYILTLNSESKKTVVLRYHMYYQTYLNISLLVSSFICDLFLSFKCTSNNNP